MKFKSHVCSEKMHFESAAEMSKGNSSCKDLLWHVKQAIPKTHFQPRAPCSHPLSLAAQTVPWDWGTADPRWAPSEQRNAWRENAICESKQWVRATARTELCELSPAPAQPGHSRWHSWSSSTTHGQHTDTQDIKTLSISNNISNNNK